MTATDVVSYNACIFQVVRGNEYEIEFAQIGSATTDMEDVTTLGNTTALVNLTREWEQIYNVDFLSGYRNLYLLVDDLRVVFDSTARTYQSANTEKISFPSFDFPTRLHIRYSDIKPTDPAWQMKHNWIQIPSTDNASSGIISAHVHRAWAEPSPYNSKIQMSLWFMLIVISCNTLKVAAIFLTIHGERQRRLVTLGDTVASFLDKPDRCTRGYCAMSRETFLWRFGQWKRVTDGEQIEEFQRNCEGYWESRKMRYGSSISLHRRMFATLT